MICELSQVPMSLQMTMMQKGQSPLELIGVLVSCLRRGQRLMVKDRPNLKIFYSSWVVFDFYIWEGGICRQKLSIIMNLPIVNVARREEKRIRGFSEKPLSLCSISFLNLLQHLPLLESHSFSCREP